MDYNILETLERMKTDLLKIDAQLEFKIIENSHFIIEVGFLTVSTDENGNVILKNTLLPTQFTKNTIDEIIQIKFKNANNQFVTPIIYSKNDWYLARKQNITETIVSLEQSLINNK